MGSSILFQQHNKALPRCDAEIVQVRPTSSSRSTAPPPIPPRSSKDPRNFPTSTYKDLTLMYEDSRRTSVGGRGGVSMELPLDIESQHHIASNYNVQVYENSATAQTSPPQTDNQFSAPPAVIKLGP